MLANMLKALSLLLLVVVLAGCDGQPSRPPEVSDDVYNSDVSSKGQWQVRYSGRVTIEIDPDGTVNVYGIKYTSGNSTILPDVKVSGKAVFKVHNIDNVKADDGVTLYAYNSNLVKASHNARIFAYNCARVLAVHDVGLIEPHGITKVEKLRGPAPQAPVQALEGPANGQPGAAKTP